MASSLHFIGSTTPIFFVLLLQILMIPNSINAKHFLPNGEKLLFCEKFFKNVFWMSTFKYINGTNRFLKVLRFSSLLYIYQIVKIRRRNYKIAKVNNFLLVSKLKENSGKLFTFFHYFLCSPVRSLHPTCSLIHMLKLYNVLEINKYAYFINKSLPDILREKCIKPKIQREGSDW